MIVWSKTELLRLTLVLDQSLVSGSGLNTKVKTET